MGAKEMEYELRKNDWKIYKFIYLLTTLDKFLDFPLLSTLSLPLSLLSHTHTHTVLFKWIPNYGQEHTTKNRFEN